MYYKYKDAGGFRESECDFTKRKDVRTFINNLNSLDIVDIIINDNEVYLCTMDMAGTVMTRVFVGFSDSIKNATYRIMESTSVIKNYYYKFFHGFLPDKIQIGDGIIFVNDKILVSVKKMRHNINAFKMFEQNTQGIMFKLDLLQVSALNGLQKHNLRFNTGCEGLLVEFYLGTYDKNTRRGQLLLEHYDPECDVVTCCFNGYLLLNELVKFDLFCDTGDDYELEMFFNQDAPCVMKLDCLEIMVAPLIH